MREEVRTEVGVGLSCSGGRGGFSFFLRGFLIDTYGGGIFSVILPGLKSECLRITLMPWQMGILRIKSRLPEPQGRVESGEWRVKKHKE